MINATGLLADLQSQQKNLEKDLRDQVGKQPELKQALEADYRAARAAQRTGETFGSWCDEQLTQAAVAWLLGCVFLRFSEDNGLIPAPLLAGPGDGTRQAREQAREYFGVHPTENERHYLEHCFRQLAQYPAVASLYDPAHNPLFRLPLSYDGAKALVTFWQRVDPDSGRLVHDFTDPDLNTRFLGDLYQDLSESARKRYALLQTPEFVEEFILERTLEPAIRIFGLDTVRMIDPTCGSGHFLLGGFYLLLDHWEREAPGLDIRERVKRAVGAVFGVDINPFAVAIARFRLLVAALKAIGIRTLKEAPGWRFNVTAGDSLLHGRRFGELDLGGDELLKHYGHVYAAEDRDEIERILGKQYHVVVGNPPYITVKDNSLNQLYRKRYQTCHRKYALAVPFAERFFQLAALPSAHGECAGYVGMITANSFMKREFGKKLVESFFPGVDLTHIIDTSGAYIPGHGTPTVILFGRHQPPVAPEIRTVMGIKGEPTTPQDPAKGYVWSAILEQIDKPRSESEWVSAADTPRESFSKHPWSTGGGGASTLRDALEAAAISRLDDLVASIGFGAIMGEDEAFLMPLAAANSKRFPSDSRVLIKGEQVRNWAIDPFYAAIFPYDEKIRFSPSGAVTQFLWPWRSLLWARVTFGRQTYREACRGYEEYHQIPIERNRIRYAISFGEVATHNHFSFDRENRLFDKTAPVITLQRGATEQDHLSLLGLLNSSTACFWFKQVCFPKGGDHVGQKGARVRKTLWDERYAFNATNVGNFPISTNAPTFIAEALDRKAREQQSHLPQNLSASFPLSRDDLNAHRTAYDVLLREMIAVQEELDWWCYHSYGICDESLTYPGTPPEVQLGERAFEIVLARKLAAGQTETTWFQRHGSTPITEIPNHWPTDYRALVDRRIALIESSSWIELVERPEYKRRWNQPSWEIREQTALKDWLLDRLETPRYWPERLLRSVDELTAIAERDEAFMDVGRLFTGQVGFDVRALVALLLEDTAVPALRVLRYKESGLRKRADWEQTWDLQRREDAIDAQVAAELSRAEDESDEDWQVRLKKAQDARKKAEIGEIPVPPKYKKSDFLSNTLWRLRGALDVPKERVFCLPNGDPAGGSLYGWAGWNAAERVRAIFGTYTEAATRKGWAVAQLLPLLGAIEEEMPWVLQSHNDMDPEFGVRLGDFFREQLGQELHKHGVTREDLANWKPAAGGRGRRRRAQT